MIAVGVFVFCVNETTCRVSPSSLHKKSIFYSVLFCFIHFESADSWVLNVFVFDRFFVISNTRPGIQPTSLNNKYVA